MATTATLHILFLIALALCIAWGVRIVRGSASTSLPDRWIRALIPATALCWMVQIAYKVYDAAFSEHSWIRFEKTWAVALGFPLYYGPESGPALATIYGPVSVLFYLPATLTRNPIASIQIAQLLAVLIYYLPVLWLHTGPAFRHRRSYAFSILAFLCFGFASILVTSTRQGVFIVHADAPTLGLAALSCALIYFRNHTHAWLSLFFSALFAVLAVWSKQVAVPLLPAVTLYLWMTDGWKAAFRYILCLLITGLTISGIFVLSFDPQNMIFNMFTVPSRHPFREGGFLELAESASRIFRDWLIMSAWGVFSMGPLFFSKSRPRPLKKWLGNNPWSLFLFVAFFMAPIAALSNYKVGGSNNTLSHATYYFLIASTLAFVSAQVHTDHEARWISYLGKAVIVLLSGIFLLIYIPSGFYRIHSVGKETDFARVAFEFAKKHPGQTYFPRMTVVHLLQEGKLYHTADGLMDRDWAGIPISEEHFRRHIPDLDKLRWIAFHGEDHRQILPLDDFAAGYTNEKDLPGFTVYRPDVS